VTSIIIFQSIIVFLLGISFGSFLNVVIDRFATHRSISKGRSYCESCKKTLGFFDLIPLLSYIFLLGKCRYCKTKIPARLFVTELLGGITLLYIFINYFYLSPFNFLLLSVISFIFIAIFFIDLDYGIIPDKLVALITIFSLIYIIAAQGNIWVHILSGVGSIIFFLGLFVITRGRGMGFGDVKLSFALGLLLGFPMIIYGLYIAFLTGALISIILVLWKKRSFKKGTVPFGPFLVASTLFALFFGEKLIMPLVRIIF